MATAPLFKINQVVYLNESAHLGELEAYKIGAIQQAQADRWVYQIFIEKRPPDSQTVEDRIDLRFPRELFYGESELLTLCEATNIALLTEQRRINRMMGLHANCSGSAGYQPPKHKKGDSLFNINDTVYVKASAGKGFLETYQVTNIHKQPSVSEFMYELNIYGNPQVLSDVLDLSKFRQLFFRESELLDQCGALDIALGALERKVARLLAIKEAFCPSPEGSGSGSV